MGCSLTEIGKRVAALREKKCLTQEALAGELHISREVIAKMETGSRDLKVEYTVLLADYFGVPCDYILRGIESEQHDIHNATGFDSTVIDNFIKWKFYNRGDLFRQRKRHELINALCQNEHGYTVLDHLADYLFDEYSDATAKVINSRFINTGRTETVTIKSDTFSELSLSLANKYMAKLKEDLESGESNA